MGITPIQGNRAAKYTVPFAHAAILFGSAAADQAVKPASVRATCEAIGLARSTYYYQSRRSMSAIELEHRIVVRLHELRDAFPTDGYRKMTLQLQLEGFRVNRKRIARLMQLHGLTLRTPICGDGSVRRRQPATAVANLWQTMRLTKPHQVWIADIAYVRIGSGLVYVAAIIDAWSREVEGYAVSLQINPRLASIALHAAVRAHRPAPGSVHHSNCGSQYVMRGYTDLLRHYGLIPSAGDVVSQIGLRPANRARAPQPRQVVEMHEYRTWDQVIGNVREFIQILYSPQRIEWILGVSVGHPVE